MEKWRYLTCLIHFVAFGDFSRSETKKSIQYSYFSYVKKVNVTKKKKKKRQ